MTGTDSRVKAAPSRSSGKRVRLGRIRDRDNALLLGILVLVLILGGLTVPSIFQADNLANVARSTAIVGIAAVGMTFVLLTGELDLSIGSILSLSLVTGGLFLGAGSAVALLVTALTGVVLGVINGLVIGYAGVNSLIMTLGTLALYGGVANVVARGQAVYLYDASMYAILGKGAVLGVPIPVAIFFVVVGMSTYVLQRTVLGFQINFSGANGVAAWYSGINVARTKLVVFALSGLLAAVAGPLLASMTNRITPTLGDGFELGAIAVAVLGGTALAGGRGSALGTLIGAFTFGFVTNILALSGFGSYMNQVLRGALLIVVVFVFQRFLSRRGQGVAA